MKRILTLSIIILLLAEIVPLHAPVLAQAYTEVLPVVQYDQKYNASWVFYGSAPYLDDGISSRISANGNGSCGWFLFGDPVYQASQVYLEIYGISGRSDEYDHANVTVSDGTGELQATVHFDFEYTWKSINLTSFLNSQTKQANAKIRFESNMTEAYRLSIAIAQLRIYIGPYPIVYGLTEKRAGMNTTAYCKWYSSKGISTYAFNHNASGSWLTTNITGTSSGTTVWTNQTFVLPNATTDCVGIQFYSNDTENHWETTGVIILPIVSEYFSPESANFIGDASQWTFAASPDGRKTFYATNTKLFFCFWIDNTTRLYYSYSSNNASWHLPVFVEDTGTVLVGAYAVYCENRGGTDYVHYSYCAWQENKPLRYRRGMIQTNGAIIWGDLQTALGDSCSSVGNLAITSLGQVFISYSTLRQSDNQWTQWVIFSNRTDGTWSTYADYPRNVTNNVAYVPEGSRTSIYSMNEHDAYVIVSTQDQVIQGRMILNHTLQATENVTSYIPVDEVFFSGVSYQGNIHLVYRDSNNTLRYCWRNHLSGSWEIRDEFVTDYLTPAETGDTYSFPELCYDQNTDLTIVCWATFEDNSVWMIVRNNTAWNIRKRILVIPDGYRFALMPSTIIPYSKVDLLFSIELRSVADDSRKVFCYLQDAPFIVGDINRDGIVNMRDIGIVCDAFGSRPEIPGWNADCDVNFDGVVNMRDVGIVCSNFGRVAHG